MNICRLDQLSVGTEAMVKNINCSGMMKRRLKDLGMIEGTCVKCVLKSPCGDPAAYMIRGAVIALRNDDAGHILVQ